jgi:hypothetical protein
MARHGEERGGLGKKERQRPARRGAPQVSGDGEINGNSRSGRQESLHVGLKESLHVGLKEANREE